MRKRQVVLIVLVLSLLSAVALAWWHLHRQAERYSVLVQVKTPDRTTQCVIDLRSPRDSILAKLTPLLDAVKDQSLPTKGEKLVACVTCKKTVAHKNLLFIWDRGRLGAGRETRACTLDLAFQITVSSPGEWTVSQIETGGATAPLSSGRNLDIALGHLERTIEDRLMIFRESIGAVSK